MPELATNTFMAQTSFTASAIRQYRTQIHRWIVRRLRNPDVADDVTQEVFLRLCCVSRSAGYIRDPLSYLLGIAAHVISAYRMAEVRSRISFDTEAVQRAADHTDTLDEHSEERLDVQLRLERALEQLPPRYKDVLLLCKEEGMTYGEAALASGLSIHTVEKYLIRARAQLAQLMCDR
jgi:RNA polymerase sigma factor (sigma-70 family)